ncbi:rNA polymerase sigma factor [Coprobacillus sp. CAG:826]|nr:rNA polymerase sigma factor [Coprobacillus sp. CAG:826]
MATSNVDYDLLKRAKDGDKQALDEACKIHTPLVISLCSRYQSGMVDKEDLVSVGMLGLLKAIQQFDENFGVQFSTYAVPLILGEIKRFFRDDGVIKVSRQYKELYLKIQKKEKELEMKLERAVTIDDLAKELDVPREDIHMAIESHYYPTSLSTPMDDDHFVFEDTLGENDVIEELDKMDLLEALKKLDPKEQLLIKMRYFDEMKQQECAERFFVSQVQISRMEKKILEKLKRMLVS